LRSRLFTPSYIGGIHSDANVACRLRSTSISVVAQEDTLIRIAVLSCHTVPPPPAKFRPLDAPDTSCVHLGAQKTPSKLVITNRSAVEAGSGGPWQTLEGEGGGGLGAGALPFLIARHKPDLPERSAPPHSTPRAPSRRFRGVMHRLTTRTRLEITQRFPHQTHEAPAHFYNNQADVIATLGPIMRIRAPNRQIEVPSSSVGISRDPRPTTRTHQSMDPRASVLLRLCQIPRRDRNAPVFTLPAWMTHKVRSDRDADKLVGPHSSRDICSR